MLGNNATDDPEGEVILETIGSTVDERVIVIAVDDPVLVNALQRQKGAAVIGGNVGRIRRQIEDGENGFLVATVDQLPSESCSC